MSDCGASCRMCFTRPARDLWGRLCIVLDRFPSRFSNSSQPANALTCRVGQSVSQQPRSRAWYQSLTQYASQSAHGAQIESVKHSIYTLLDDAGASHSIMTGNRAFIYNEHIRVPAKLQPRQCSLRSGCQTKQPRSLLKQAIKWAVAGYELLPIQKIMIHDVTAVQ